MEKGRCQFCGDLGDFISEWAHPEKISEHLVVTLNGENGYIHVHGPLDKPKVMKDMIEAIVSNCPGDDPVTGSRFDEKRGEVVPPEKVLFRCEMRIGDTIAMTGAIRDFHRAFPETKIWVQTSSMLLWKHCPYVEDGPAPDDAKVVDIGPGFVTNKSNSWNRSLVDAFRIDIERKLGVEVPMTDFRPEIWMSEQEKAAPPLVEGPYWIITVGGEPGWPVKMYPMLWWQKVVDHFKGKIQFVQLQLKDDPYPELDGVVSLRGQTEGENLRNLLNVFYHAQGSLGLVSMQTHLAAAFDLPCVTVAAGREPLWFTYYLGQQHLHTCGTLPCSVDKDRGREKVTACWKCSIEACKKHMEKRGTEIPEDDEEMGFVPPCVRLIPPSEVIRAIEKYYDGGRLRYGEKLSNKYFTNFVQAEDRKEECESGSCVLYLPKNPPVSGRKINVLASLSTAGGGEQSVAKIASLLGRFGWRVRLFSWGRVHEKFQSLDCLVGPKEEMPLEMHKNAPLLFYANDQINEFCDLNLITEIVRESRQVIVAVNFVNGKLPKCEWLDKTGKLSAVLFQNREKMEEFIRDRGDRFASTKLEILPGAIEIEKFVSYPLPKRDKDAPLVVLKHCVPDYRKYVTEKSVGRGEQIHVWQKHIIKETDVRFYERLLKDVSFDIRFEFMEAHPELERAFRGEKRMVFWKWDELPVGEFLSRGHVFLYRTSNLWRDNYPRVVGEALAAGLPVLSEPRDGTRDRIVHGDTGFYCVDYDGFLYALRLLRRKEEYRLEMGKRAREWAIKNLHPDRWHDVLYEIVGA